VVEELEDSKGRITKDHIPVLQLVNNVAFHAMTSEDNIIPCRKDITGKYHVDGNLLLASPPPTELIKLFLRNCLLIFMAVAELAKLVLVLIPRYSTKAC
jgi:hypothetical protein